MTNDQTETGLPVDYADEKRHMSEESEVQHEKSFPGDGTNRTRGSTLCDSASIHASTQRESHQTQQLQIDPSGSRESASILTREVSWHTTEGGDCTMEELPGTGAVADVKDEPVAQETTGSTRPVTPSNAEAEAAEEQVNKQRPSPPNSEFPQWVINNCVTTCEELRDSPIDLILEEIAFPAVDKQPTSEDGEEPDGCQEGPPAYRMASILFEPLLGVLRSTAQGVISPIEVSKRVGNSFATDIIRLQTPIAAYPYTTVRFLHSVVRHFAKTSNADLIALDQDDLEDLADHFKRREKEQVVDDTSMQHSVQDYLSFLFKRPIDSPPTSPSSETSGSDVEQRRDQKEYPNASIHGQSLQISEEIPNGQGCNKILQHSTNPSAFSAITTAPKIKRIRCLDVANAQDNTPLIIHLIINACDLTTRLVNDLRRYFVRPFTYGTMIIISTESPPRPSYGFLPHSKPPDWSRPGYDTDVITFIPVTPMPSESQEVMIKNDGELEIRARNIRSLQRLIRRRVPKDFVLPLLDPYNEWAFLDINSDAATFLAQAALTGPQLEGVQQMIGSNFDEKRIKRAFLSIEAREKALRAWNVDYRHFPSLPVPESESSIGTADSDSDTDYNSSMDERWSNFPLHIQDVIHKIEDANPEDIGDRFYWEQRFLDLLVDPKEVEKGWSDIAIDPETEEEIKEVIKQHMDSAKPSASYGILKQGNIGGALLYGPPGTGKTQLARVLACVSKSVVICASSADIENKWAGEMPKAIRGLFNLGKLLAPSVIFIDEADSLFQSRNSSSDSPDWRRDNVNQMLAEMDGMTKSTTTPLVLLSTNHPSHLDPAVLRRVPSHLYIGLPSTALREKIFNIVLREEVLSADVSSKLLSLLTHHYSGSDIRNLCFKAAIMCKTWVENEEQEKKRLLTRALFKKALERTRPTATKPTIAAIRSFAKDHDPAILQKMQDFETEESIIQRRTVAQLRDLEEQETESEIEGDWESASEKLLSNPSTGIPSTIPAAPPLASLNRVEAQVSGSPSIKAAEKAENNVLESNTPSNLYKPLEKGSKKIRVLSIQPLSDDESSDVPVSCSIEEVDLSDWTPVYRSFLNSLPTMENDFRLIDGRIRHVLWDLHNYAIRHGLHLRDNFRPLSPIDVKQNISLHAYCDKPLEQFPGLDDRYNWGDFVALSYVWGDQTHKKTISLNGSPFEVGSNLYEALLSLRTSFEVKSRGLKVWIDAICINQDDLKERATEVQKMETIYSEALVVRAWLGNPSPEVSTELSLVRKMLDDFSGVMAHSPTSLNLESLQHTQQRQELEMSQDYLTLMAQDENNACSLWISIEGITQAAYWQRLWIIQEVALGSSLLFWYGDHYFTSKELGSFRAIGLWNTDGCFVKLRRYFGHDRFVASLSHTMKLILRIGSLRWDDGNSIHKGKKPVVESITQAKVSYASDPRDKVYGILAFLPPTIASRIRPYYDTGFTWQACWTMFAQSCYEGEGNLNLLARSAGKCSGDPATPTWIFDLSPPKSKYSLSIIRPEGREIAVPDIEDEGHMTHGDVQTFQSNKDLGKSCQPWVDANHLFCKGAVVDTVGAIASLKGQAKQATVPSTHHAHSGLPPLWNSAQSRLSLARVLAYDSHFEFGQRPSLLEVPWISPAELPKTEDGTPDIKIFEDVRGTSDQLGKFDFKVVNVDETSRNGVSWAEIFAGYILPDIYSRVLHPNESFELQGMPLKDYFTSRTEYCKNPPETKLAVDLAAELLMWRRLFQTENGFIGIITRHAVPGDKIAILYNCDMPVVLRPSAQGDTYEVVGGCFVEGYMKGELVEDIKSGKFKTETFCLV